jgi:PEP-CTERM motif/Cohesin domain
MRLATILTIAGLALPWCAPAATISLQGPAAPVAAGSSFFLNVNVVTDSGENIWAYQFDILFDPAVLQFLNAKDGTFLPVADLALATLTWDPYTPGDGAVTGISNALSGDAPGVSGAGLLAQAQFLALAPSTGTFLSPLNTILLDSALDQLGTVTEAGIQVTVNAAAPGVPEPGTFTLLGLGLAAAGLWRFRRSIPY